MDLQTCLEIAEDIGLDTVGEALYNVKIHALTLLDYGCEKEQYSALCTEVVEKGYTNDTLIADVLNKKV